MYVSPDLLGCSSTNILYYFPCHMSTLSLPDVTSDQISKDFLKVSCCFFNSVIIHCRCYCYFSIVILLLSISCYCYFITYLQLLLLLFMVLSYCILILLLSVSCYCDCKILSTVMIAEIASKYSSCTKFIVINLISTYNEILGFCYCSSSYSLYP